jgi:hypothetical protein
VDWECWRSAALLAGVDECCTTAGSSASLAIMNDSGPDLRSASLPVHSVQPGCHVRHLGFTEPTNLFLSSSCHVMRLPWSGC